MDAPDTELGKERTVRVAVLGGGIAGLSAARRLAEAGLNTTLFERFDLLGGKAKGWETLVPEFEERGSQPVEHGIHAWWPTYINFNTFFAEHARETDKRKQPFVLLDFTWWIDAVTLKNETGSAARAYIDKRMSDELFAILRKGGLWRLFNPFRWQLYLRMLQTGLRMFGAWDAVKMGFAGLALKQVPVISGWLRRFDSFRHLCFLLSPNPPEPLDEISVDQLATRLNAGRKSEDVLGVINSLGTYGDPTKHSAFHLARLVDFYFLRTPDTMWMRVCPDSCHADAIHPLLEWVREYPVTMHGQTPVTAIKKGDDRHFKLTYLEGGREERESEFDYIVSSLDPESTKRLLSKSDFPGAEALRAKKIEHYPSNQLTVIRIWFRKEFADPDKVPIGLPIAGSERTDCPFDFVFIPSRVQRRRDHPPGEVIEFHLSHSGRFDGFGEQELVDRTTKWAFLIFPDLKTNVNPVLHRVVNVVRNYSAVPPGHLEIAPEIRGEADRFYVCGDWVRYPDSSISYMEKAMVTGIEAARAIAQKEGRDPGSAPRPLPEGQPFQLEAERIVREPGPL